MSRSRSQSGYNPAAEFENALESWARLTNGMIRDSVRMGQPFVDAYFKGVSSFTPGVRKVSSRCCEIPETDCPPRCVCELNWDVCQGDVAKGTLDISNTGKQAVNFKLDASDFVSDQDDSGVAPVINPSNFSLASGETKKIAISVQVGKGFDANERYTSEIKVAGRYEQCVQLSLYVRRRVTPHCKVEHGEIPRRTVAHHWYDHFQCEELCFEPVLQRATPTPGKPAATVVTAGKEALTSASERVSSRSKRSKKE